MEICRKVAGYSYGRADLVRRAMAKKKLDVMEKERHNFIYGLKNEDGSVACVGAVANGVDERTANELFDEMSNFAKYAFNKSHAAAYAFVSYQTAWLKCYYPCELMAATLTSVLDQTAKVTSYIGECNSIGIRVLPPDVNESFDGFSVSGSCVRFGLLAIKNLGRGFIRTIIEKRKIGGRYFSFYDFCKRTYGKEFNKRAVESLIKSGALDNLGLNRRQMISMLPLIISGLDGDRNRNIVGQIGFFDDGSQFAHSNEPKAPNIEELPYNELLAGEKDVLGIYVSGHPMKEYEAVSLKLNADKISDIIASDGVNSKYKDNTDVTVYGMISRIERKTTKNGSTMCFLDIEDLTGTVECIMFSNLYAERAILVQDGNIVLIRGRVSIREDRAPSVVCRFIDPNPKNVFKSEEKKNISDEKTTITKKKKRQGIFIRVNDINSNEINKLKLLSEITEGSFPVYVFEVRSGKYNRFGYTENSTAVVNELKSIFGEENVVLQT